MKEKNAIDINSTNLIKENCIFLFLWRILHTIILSLKSKYSNLIQLHFLLILINILIVSCNPNNDFDPSEYEKYITISSDQTPSISPDGNWVAYFHKTLQSSESLEYPTGLYIMDINGLNHRLVLQGSHFQPSWSPDGDWLVFSSNGILQIKSFKGDSIRSFKGIGELPLFFPDWSKDNGLILFCSPFVEGGGGFTCTKSFDSIKQIYNHHQFNAYPIKWFKNSTLIGCKFSKEWEYEEIFSIDTGLTNQVRLTINTKSDRDPSYSSVNNFIVWCSNIRICRMDEDGKNIKQLDYGQYPALSPDGNYIIYSNANLDYTKEVLWRIDKDGKNKIQLTF